MPLPPPFEARLTSARMLTPSVRELAFERTDGLPVRFEPGQWMNALLPLHQDGQETRLKRSYSIASSPDGSPRFEIAVTRVQDGPGSTFLHAAEPGLSLAFTGPQGFFTRPLATAGPSLMIATGTGVTPIRSMIRAAVAAGDPRPIWLLLGVRHRQDILYEDELRALRECAPRTLARFEVTLSQPDASWTGRRGYVQTHLHELFGALRDAAGEVPHVYACGLERMVGSVRAIARSELNVPRERVHSERYD